MILATLSRRTLSSACARFDALDGQLDPAELSLDSDVQREEREDVRLQRDTGAQILHLKRDLIDAELRDVEQDIGVSSRSPGSPVKPASGSSSCSPGSNPSSSAWLMCSTFSLGAERRRTP
jgi:hypothetical protein